jgi:hypothetical protein
MDNGNSHDPAQPFANGVTKEWTSPRSYRYRDASGEIHEVQLFSAIPAALQIIAKDFPGSKYDGPSTLRVNCPLCKIEHNVRLTLTGNQLKVECQNGCREVEVLPELAKQSPAIKTLMARKAKAKAADPDRTVPTASSKPLAEPEPQPPVEPEPSAGKPLEHLPNR